MFDEKGQTKVNKSKLCLQQSPFKNEFAFKLAKILLGNINFKLAFKFVASNITTVPMTKYTNSSNII